MFAAVDRSASFRLSPLRSRARSAPKSTVIQDALAANHLRRRLIGGGKPQDPPPGAGDKSDAPASYRRAYYSGEDKSGHAPLDNLRLFLTCQWSPTIGWRSPLYLPSPAVLHPTPISVSLMATGSRRWSCQMACSRRKFRDSKMYGTRRLASAHLARSLE